MFANQEALRTLVLSDSLASDEQKHEAIKVIERNEADGPVGVMKPLVVSFDEAARLLGFSDGQSKSKEARLAVSRAIANGIIKGWYSGKNRQRARGVLFSSIVEATKDAEGESK